MLRNLCPFSRKMKRYCRVLITFSLIILALLYAYKKLNISDSSAAPNKHENTFLSLQKKNDNKKDTLDSNALFHHSNGLGSDIYNEKELQGTKTQSIVNKLKPKLHKAKILNNEIRFQNDSLWADQLGAAKNEKEQKLKEDGYNTYAFNTLVSQRLGLLRTLPDTRHKECKKLKYSTELPSASVIICYYHEELNVLLRTIHSVLERTPSDTLKEVLVINDHSDIDISQNITTHLGMLNIRALQL